MRPVSSRRAATALALAVASVAAVPASGLARPGAQARAAATNVYLTGDCRHPQSTPSTVILACGDANTFVRSLRWTHWNTSLAVGRGTLSVNSCVPNCAAGHFQSYPAVLQVSRAIACGASHSVQYTRATLFLNGRRPGGLGRQSRWRLICR